MLMVFPQSLFVRDSVGEVIVFRPMYFLPSFSFEIGDKVMLWESLFCGQVLLVVRLIA